MPSTDPSLNDTLKCLQNQHQALLDKLDAITDPKLARATVAEAAEVLHRINRTQNLVLAAVGPELAAAIRQVAQADGQLTAELRDVADTTKLVTSVAGFLKVVDEALDLAKTLA